MEKIYAGSGKIITTKYGELTKISLSRKDVNTLTDYLNDNDTEWVNLVLKEKQNKVEGKPTHYLEVDEWKPTGGTEKANYAPSAMSQNKPEKKEVQFNDDADLLPF
jgi:hypothetical protein